MLTETTDAGFLRVAVERKNDERSAIAKFATAIMQNMSPERQRINQSLKDQFQCTRSPMTLSVRK